MRWCPIGLIVILALLSSVFSRAMKVDEEDGISPVDNDENSDESRVVEHEYDTSSLDNGHHDGKEESSEEDSEDGSGEQSLEYDVDEDYEEEVSGEEEDQPVYSDANQTLHELINNDPIESFVLLSPQYQINKKYGIVLLVISTAADKEVREEIRETWAAKSESKMQNKGKSLVIFLVGRSSELDEEAETHGDLLQVDIEETYRNLVYKIEVGFRWLSENVRADFVAKIDSDTVVHIDRMYRLLIRYEMALRDENAGGRDWIACYEQRDLAVIRSNSDRWYVSEADYAEANFPKYCSGPGYVIKRQTLKRIVARMGDIKVFEVEDAFFTGVVAHEISDFFFISQGIAAPEFTNYSECDSVHGPSLCILNTDYQLGDEKSDRNLTAAWEQLKSPKCHNMYDINEDYEEEASGEEEDQPVYADANQTLHELINNDPIESFVLQSPQYQPLKKYGIVLLVISAAQDKEVREEIRKTWAAKEQSKMQNKRKSLVIFLVGRSSELDEEAESYGDLLQSTLRRPIGIWFTRSKSDSDGSVRMFEPISLPRSTRILWFTSIEYTD